MSPFLAKRLTDNLLDFKVPYVNLFKTKVTKMDRQAREVLSLEEYVSIEKYPSIRSLLKFIPGPLTITSTAVAHMEIACFENEDDMAILQCNINDLEGLLVVDREVGKDPFSARLVHGEYPPLVKKLALLQAAAQKDGIKWAQQGHYRLILKT
ncbi:hypothetical protein AMTRI_Chr07g27960 [Amborella trichopoda]